MKCGTLAAVSVLSLFAVVGLASAQDPQVFLFKDINPTAKSNGFGGGAVVLDGVALFSAFDAAGGSELWRSDGTPDGTYRVKDINPGPGGSGVRTLTRFGPWVMFQAMNALWRSDGTEAGTVQVAAVAFNAPNPEAPGRTTAVSNGVFFFASGAALWKSDGTAAGTVKVKDLAWFLDNLTDVAGTLFFRAPHPTTGRYGLWKSDGNVNGTVVVSDVDLGDPHGFPFTIAEPEFAAVGNTLYFTTEDPVKEPDVGLELWKSDGISTVLVKDIRPGSGWSFPTGLTEFKGELYFLATDGVDPTSLWKSDGTFDGTVQVQAARTFPDTPLGPLVQHDGELYFAAYAQDGGRLWKSDGLTAGTVPVKELPGRTGFVPVDLTSVGSVLFFAAYADGSGLELWRSNGNASGTSMVKDINPGLAHGTGAFYPPSFVDLDGALFFAADDGVFGINPWISDGTAAGTLLLKDINRRYQSHSDPKGFLEVGDHLYFRATGAGTGNELWRTDGTRAGTELVKDLAPGALDSMLPWDKPRLAGADGAVYYVADDQTNGKGLWKTDGTAAGTILLRTFDPGPVVIDSLFAVGDTVYFRADETATGTELWKTDGTPAGTVLVKDIYPGTGRSWPEPLLAFGGKLVFRAFNPSYGYELWVTDGTETVLLKDISTGSASSNPKGLTAANGYFLFGLGSGLWRSDGITTEFVASVSFNGGFLRADGTVLFSGNDPIHGSELWTTDGTAGGTRLVKDINTTGASGSFPTEFAEQDGSVIFVATTQLEGRSIWKTDGTAAGTVLVKSFAPAFATPSSFLRWVDGTRIFHLKVLVIAQWRSELWTTDGTEAGTVRVGELPSGFGQSEMVRFGDKLFFSSDDGQRGRELWAFGVPDAGDQVADLIDDLAEVEIDGGGGNGLAATLGNALDKLTDEATNNDNGAAGQLQAFIHQIEAKRGNALTEEQADALIAAAQAILDGLEG